MTKLTVLPLEMIQTLQRVFSVGRRPNKGLQPGSKTVSGTVETERQRWAGEKRGERQREHNLRAIADSEMRSSVFDWFGPHMRHKGTATETTLENESLYS